MTYRNLFDTLWHDYTTRNPHAEKVHQLLQEVGEHKILNDHVAFRTFNHPKVGIEVLAKFFVAHGYHEQGTYDFPVKKLFAKHYEHENSTAPKVFISELLLENFSPSLQKTVNECVAKIPNEILDSESLLSAGVFWPLHYKTYRELLEESEYAAWMYAFGFCANHFTVNINAFSNLREIADVNHLLEYNGFKLNSSGGLIKGSPQEFLEQSSTLAEEVDVKFSEGTFKIPSCYYEFAKRYPLPNGKLYSGFVAASADKIFESTDVAARS